MLSSPLLPILRALSKERMRALEKFVHSPYHVTHAGVIQLFEFLKENLNAEDLSRKKLETVLLSKAENDPRRVYHLTNYLLETVEKFLAQEDWEKQEHLRNAATVESLRHLHLDEPATAMLRYARKRLDVDKLRGSEFHGAEYRLHWEAYHLSLQQGRAKTSNAQALSDAQDVAFICDKLRTGCLLLSHQQVTKQTYDKGLLDNVLSFLDGHQYLEIPAVAVYYHGYFAQLGGEGGDEHFARLKSLLQEHTPQFSVSETHDLFLMAINFCIRRINQQEERFFREIFDLYQSGLRHGALLENGILSRWTYNNITLTGLRLREFEWVKKFLHDYAPLLGESHREGAVNFNLARYHFGTGALREAMQHLLGIEYDDVLHNLAAKTMLCKIYFRLGETDALENQLDSIQIYLRRKKVLGYHRDNYLAIVRFIRKLLTINPNNKAERKKLREEIQAAPALTERDWLLGELDIGR
ncbi:MAG: hypothetical protein H7246_18215 [Phycisphaerae bacterium]|nr:hypothetical protein [Saprospiraceae bacterium]